MHDFDLADPAASYVFGFMQADGHHYMYRTGRKGRIGVEVKASDVGVLTAMQAVLPWPTTISYRTRTTNFSRNYESACLNLCALEGRMRLLELGLPIGRKSETIAPPAEEFSRPDYLRGLFDADGSVGFTASGLPFLSIVTASRAIAEFVCAEILRVTGAVRSAAPNKRDNVFNVMVASDPAAKLAAWMYGDSQIALDRKLIAARAVASWGRPPSMRARGIRRRWTAGEDTVVLSMPQAAAAEWLGRSAKSVNMRLWRLRNDLAGGSLRGLQSPQS